MKTGPVAPSARRGSAGVLLWHFCVALVMLCTGAPMAFADTASTAAGAHAAQPSLSAAPIPTEIAKGPTLKLGPGDTVSVQVYGRPELSTTTYVGDDGTIPMPLAGPVKVASLSPAEAAQRVAAALREGQFMVDPQVTINVVQFRSQQVSVLGEVHTPGRYPIESKTTVFDLLAQAGGTNDQSADVIYLLRPEKDGHFERYPIDLRNITDPHKSMGMVELQGGDSIYVPRAEQFYIYGEVHAPNMYRLESGMTVMQAISRGGGLTDRGSDSRIEIRRRGPDGKFLSIDARLTDPVKPNDVILVKERIF